jgi:hypothetical protein
MMAPERKITVRVGNDCFRIELQGLDDRGK